MPNSMGYIFLLRRYFNRDKKRGKAVSEWIKCSDRLPKQTQSNRSVPVLVTINNRTVNSEACFDEGDFYLHGQLLAGVTHWMPLPPPPTK